MLCISARKNRPRVCPCVCECKISNRNEWFSLFVWKRDWNFGYFSDRFFCRCFFVFLINISIVSVSSSASTFVIQQIWNEIHSKFEWQWKKNSFEIKCQTIYYTKSTWKMREKKDLNISILVFGSSLNSQIWMQIGKKSRKNAILWYFLLWAKKHIDTHSDAHTQHFALI